MPLPIVSAFVFLAALALAAALLALLRQVTPAGFLAAAVTERSDHELPTRQLGGLGVVPAAFFAGVAGFALIGTGGWTWLAPVLAMLLLFLLGLADDRAQLPAAPKLAVQLAASILAVTGLGAEFAFLGLPAPVSHAAAALVITAFVNLVNFMDGMDLMTVAGAGTALFFGAFLAVSGGDRAALLAGLALAGALVGFGWHNRPKAGVFLGDSGSLPLGLAAGYLALLNTGSAGTATAFLPFAYFLVDTGSTLVKRGIEGKNVLRAHSEHAYQHARRNGLSPWQIAIEVAVIGIATGALALAAAATEGTTSGALAAAGWLTAAGFVVRLRRR